MSTVLRILEKNKNKKVIKKSDEFRFFRQFKGLLKSHPLYQEYYDVEDEFDVIKANIIIKSIINKLEIERLIEKEYSEHPSETIDQIKERIENDIKELPHINYPNQKVYIPFFNKSTNLLYTTQNEKLKEVPYNSLIKKFEPFYVDAFETYNIDLFTSLFTKFVKIYNYKNSAAFYHYDMNAIFIISNQGALENVIFLFDKYLKNPHKSNAISRTKELIEAYFNNDLDKFIFVLYNNEFVSNKTFKKICKAIKK